VEVEVEVELEVVNLKVGCSQLQGAPLAELRLSAELDAMSCDLLFFISRSERSTSRSRPLRPHPFTLTLLLASSRILSQTGLFPLPGTQPAAYARIP